MSRPPNCGSRLATATPAQEPAYFDFVRMFMHYPADGAGWGEQITAHFTAPQTVQLGLRRGGVQAADVAELSGWFAAVEASPAFQAGGGVAGAGPSRFALTDVEPDGEEARRWACRWRGRELQQDQREQRASADAGGPHGPLNSAATQPGSAELLRSAAEGFVAC